MAIRVLVVDDSRFFRKRVSEIIAADSQLEVVATAENGSEAVDMATKFKPDVITMDVEMPVMDGITAVKRIMAACPTPILMFSSLTTEGAQATLDALDAGALDFLPKKFEDISRNREEANRQLRSRIKQIATHRVVTAVRSMSSMPTQGSNSQVTPLQPNRSSEVKSADRSQLQKKDETIKRDESSIGNDKNRIISPKRVETSLFTRGTHIALKPGELRNFQILAIGTSTGGPVALQEILTKLPENFPLPIVLVQHMPGTFTAAFAQRLNKVCKIRVQEAVEGDVLQPGLALLAPGGKQMLLQRRGGQVVIRIHSAAPGQTYKPCVDITFSSIAELYPGKVLSLILTGMGADGREGIRKLKKDRSVCWAQDEASCVVFGMPGAVVEQNLADHVLPLMEIGPQLAQGM